MVYLTRGAYGGYIIRPSDLDLQSFENVDVQSVIAGVKFFYVEPSIEPCSGDICKEYNNVIEETLRSLPNEVSERFRHSFIYLINYLYVEVVANVKKVHPGYVVIDIQPKNPPTRITAKALRMEVFVGRKVAEELVRKWKLKYPENRVIQRQLYIPSSRPSNVAIKIVVETPNELVPAPITTIPVPVAPTTQQQITQQPTPVLINGFLVISTLPSKTLLDAHLPEIFKDIKIGTKEIKLVTGYFYNKLGTLSRKFYNFILPEYAIDAGFGYIVPKSKVGAFLAKVEELKREYAEFEKQLKEFLLYGKIPEDLPKRAKVERKYLEIVMEYLRQHGKDAEVRKKIEALNITERVRIHLLPFAVDMSILYEYTDERVRKELEEEIKALKEQIIAGYRERIKEYIETLNAKLQRIAVAEARKELLEKARKEIEEMEKTAKELGIEIKELEVLKEMLTPEKVEELAVKTAEGRLRALIEF